jgi:hypothetical protein
MNLVELLAQYIFLETNLHELELGLGKDVPESKEEDEDEELVDEFSSIGGGNLAGGPMLPMGMSANPKRKKKASKKKK